MIQRISEHYVNDGCAQITIGFSNSISIFSENIYDEGILCHYNFNDDSQNINKYLLDERKATFPYFNIPLYKGLMGGYYVNQLFEFNKHYLSIIDGTIRDRYFVKDGDNAIFMNRILYVPFNKKGYICSVEEIKDILEKYSEYILFDKTGKYYFIQKMSLEEIEFFINSGGGLLIRNIDDTNIIKIIKINREIGFDSYYYKECDISLNSYTVDELKYFSSKIKNIRKAAIYPCVNPNIDKKDIKEAKRLIKMLNK